MPDRDKLNGADVALLGIPVDTASSYRVGTRFGPSAMPLSVAFRIDGR
jgi:agmatinase